MTVRMFLGGGILVASLGAARMADATEGATAPAVEGPHVPRVHVSVEGPEEGVLEERVGAFEDREAGWRQLCAMPCEAVATVNPYAQHRVVDGRKTRSVSIVGRDGERLVLKYERAPAYAGLLVGGGIAVAVIGAVLLVGGGAVLASNAGPSYEQRSLCSGDAACESRWHQADADAAAKRTPGRTLAAAGAVTALAGGGAILVGILSGESSVRVARPEPDAGAAARAASWARAPIPAPPNHAALLDVRF